MTLPDGRTHDPSAARRTWLGLVVLCLPTMLLSLDLSVLFLAVPHLTADLGAGTSEQLWITDIYGFTTAGFLITMGSLGDRIGRRRPLLAGAVAFAAASVLAAFSTSPAMLIASRAMLGIAGASILPTTLALVRTMFNDVRQLGIAVAAWTTAYMAGVAIGPVVGGVMLAHFWWGSVFLLAVPVMALLLIVGPIALPDPPKGPRTRVDVPSAAISIAAILLTVHGLKEITRDGGAVLPMTAICAGLILGTWLIRRQRRLVHPTLDLRLLAVPTVSAVLVLALSVAVVQNGNAYTLTVFLQTVEALSPLAAGLWLVVPSAALVLTLNLTPPSPPCGRREHLSPSG